MNRWNQCRLIDILSSIDLSLLEGRFPETALERTERSKTARICMTERKKKAQENRRADCCDLGICRRLSSPGGNACIFPVARENAFHEISTSCYD